LFLLSRDRLATPSPTHVRLLPLLSRPLTWPAVATTNQTYRRVLEGSTRSIGGYCFLATAFGVNFLLAFFIPYHHLPSLGMLGLHRHFLWSLLNVWLLMTSPIHNDGERSPFQARGNHSHTHLPASKRLSVADSNHPESGEGPAKTGLGADGILRLRLFMLSSLTNSRVAVFPRLVAPGSYGPEHLSDPLLDPPPRNYHIVWHLKSRICSGIHALPRFPATRPLSYLLTLLGSHALLCTVGFACL
jgi:hypothetical protein